MVRSRKGTGSATATAGKGLGSLKDSGTEALQLVIAYIKQETLTPLKGLGRYVLFGVAGSLALAVGLVVLAVGFLRLLQGETGTTFEGNWSWAPYLICMVAVLAVGAVAVMAVTRGQADRNDDVRKEAP